MSRSPSVPAVEQTGSTSVMDRLRHLESLGEIDLVEEGGSVVTQAQSVAIGTRIQALSDQISALEGALSEQSARHASGEEVDMSAILQDLSASRRELTGLCNILLAGED